tara:strand:+ start:235 stop:540 length:306 start_codon:yes stop_codon:yes gene_type:complete
MTSNLEVNYQEDISKKEKDSQDFLEVLFINSDNLRSKMDEIGIRILDGVNEEQIKIKEISVVDGRTTLVYHINKDKYTSRMSMVYEGPEDAHKLAINFMEQ